MKNKGISLVELLVVMVVTGIILAAAVSMFVSSNRVFRGNRDVAEISEDVRNAVTTLEFVFSRWGAGVPCAPIGHTVPPAGGGLPGGPGTGGGLPGGPGTGGGLPVLPTPDPRGRGLPGLPTPDPIGGGSPGLPTPDPIGGGSPGLPTPDPIRDPINTVPRDATPVDLEVPPLPACTIIETNRIPPCNQYPPTDPMCMDIGRDGSVTFYGNLYGMGFVTNVQDNNARAISCRLNTAENQNCYYIWNGGRLKLGYDDNRQPIVVSLQNSLNQTDCTGGINNRVNISVNNVTLDPGDYITRVPHRIRIYVEDGWLFMDREDMAVGCNHTENAFRVRIGRVENFNVTTRGRSVRVEATFLSADGRRYRIERFYGR